LPAFPERKKLRSPANNTPPAAAKRGGTCLTPCTLNIVPTLERTLEIIANAIKLERFDVDGVGWGIT